MAHAIPFDTLAFATKKDLTELKVELIKWIIGLLFAQTTIFVAIIAVMKFIH
jgi:hypothetical protein